LLASGGDRPCGARARRLFTFEDELRPRAAVAVAALQQGTWSGRPRRHDRMRVLMLTGASPAGALAARARCRAGGACTDMVPDAHPHASGTAPHT